MKRLSCLALLLWGWLAASLPPAQAQPSGPVVKTISIHFAGPTNVSDAFIRANVRVKPGAPFVAAAADDDVASLYATGYFYNIRVLLNDDPAGGVDVTYLVQGKPILIDLKIVGNIKKSEKKIRKKITSKTGQPLDEAKLHDDAMAIKEMYQKAGYQKTTVTVAPPVVDEAAGQASVTIRIEETPKIKIKDIIFKNATAATQRQLRKVLKTRRRWMFSWLTGTGVLKEDEFDDDKEKLVEYYQNKGYIDFAINDIKFDQISPKWMTIQFDLSEGHPYKVGTVEFKGNQLFTTNEFLHGIKPKATNAPLTFSAWFDRLLGIAPKKENGPHLKLVPGAIFKPAEYNDDEEWMRDLYGTRGYLPELGGGTTVINQARTPNPATGTIDISYDINEGEKCQIEKIIIKGNVKTQDRVLRRELAVHPGEVYDTTRVKISKQRLEILDYFSKVDTEAEDTDVPNHKDLVIGVEEKGTGNFTIGAGFSSVESIVGTVEVRQGNFDLFNPPTFTGAGQKLQLRLSIGTLLQDYDLNFVEPWFLGERLSFGVDLFHRQLYYTSLHNDYRETFDGGTLSLSKPLIGEHLLVGRVDYTMEVAHLSITPGYEPYPTTNYYATTGGVYEGETYNSPSVTTNILAERGTYIISKTGLSLSSDTRNNYRTPSSGQWTTLSAELAAPPGDTDFYKEELRTSWFFPGFATNHVLEVDARGGVVSGWDGTSHVPIFERWFLGGMYTMRGYKYETVGPLDGLGEALGGDTYVFGSAEYTIPITKFVSYAYFYDIGNVYPKSFSFNPGPGRRVIDDDVGMGLRVNLPIMGGIPLRLDYGVPIMHDADVSRWGRFQFGFGYSKQF